MLALLPRHTPPLSILLADLGSPSAPAIAQALGVHPRTVRTWTRRDAAPRAVLLALWPLTRWGRSSLECEAINRAQLAQAIAHSLQRDAAGLQARIAYLERMLASVDPAANGPAWDQLSQLQPPCTIFRTAGTVRTRYATSTAEATPINT